ncbi:MAG: hypothetical protein K9W44_03990 [Candidatus Lokiarchaeota archaeon]|nr:hypothetical protein [Candidatus Harpocratesius repetitus]
MFRKVKLLFNELFNLFGNYEKKYAKKHSCEPTWKIIEDLIYLISDTVETINKHCRQLKNDIKEYESDLPSGILILLKKWQDIPELQNDLVNTNSYNECYRTYQKSLHILHEILEDIKKSESPVLRSIFERIAKSSQERFQDIGSQKGIQMLISDRRKKGLEIPNFIDPLLNKVAKILNDLPIKDLFPNELPNEDTGINPTIVKELTKHFQNVKLHPRLCGRSHIDITIDDKLAIEIKKIENNTAMDELIGQLVNDMRIKGFNIGIAYGFDQTKTKLYLRFNQQIEDTSYGFIKYVILPDPYV